jgi:uroporphyrinogen decarboxylase
MTDRERFRRQMHWEPVDRSFNMEFGYWHENFTEWEMFAKNGITSNGEADIFFNFDRIAAVGGNIWMSPTFPPKVIEDRGDTVVRLDSNGIWVEMPKDGHSTLPIYLRASIVTPDDWKREKELRFQRGTDARKVNVEALRKAYPPDRDFPVGVHCGSMIGVIRNMLTFEGIAYAIYDYPDMLEDMVETACLLVEDFLDQVLGQIDFDYASGWEDICFKSGPIVTLDFFNQVVVPRYKRIGDKLHQHGIDLWYTDCDGDVRPLMPGFLKAGINCLFPFEVNSCCHPGELLDKYQGQLRIMGGVDKMALGKGPAAIKAYLESLAPYVERGGYIPFCDHRCPPNVTQEDYLYYLDLKEEMFGMQSF